MPDCEELSGSYLVMQTLQQWVNI
ncbi:uncharacterized protein METZ01_LOCUS166560 [marine metagenome]|uniref:Uncharacterized protein n=1 Tax=marine metagenome TaxID=408172 RepID=A0A382BIN0_9ZZZZ